MTKFLFIYRSSGQWARDMAPEQMQQTLQKWGAWIAEGMQQGWMLDAGDALTQEGRVVNAKVVTDGPFVEAKEIVGGFSIVQAETFAAAAKLANGCPVLQSGGSVEVRQLAGYTTKN